MLKELEMPSGWKAQMESNGADYGQAFAWGPLRIIKSVDNTEHGRLRHVSVSCPDRLPTWDEMKKVKEEFFGDAQDAAIIFPRKELYVNEHEFCLHLWQLPQIPGSTGRWELM